MQFVADENIEREVVERLQQAAIASDAKPIIAPTRGKEPPNEYQIDLDYEDEADKILTDFLEP